MKSATRGSMCFGIMRRGWRDITSSITDPAAHGAPLPTILPPPLPRLCRNPIPDVLPGNMLPRRLFWCTGDQLGLPGGGSWFPGEQMGAPGGGIGVPVSSWGFPVGELVSRRDKGVPADLSIPTQHQRSTLFLCNWRKINRYPTLTSAVLLYCLSHCETPPRA